ncbi:MAG: hypothetical protein LBQ75_04670, partial [Zoogloeaceae bacterium]|nr:hypothetical protein [Zoogloeaceae bacterium]
MEQAQNMKRRLTDFFPPCRKWLIMALLAVNLSGCGTLNTGSAPCCTPHPLLLFTYPISVPIIKAIIWVNEAPERARVEKIVQRSFDAAQARKPLVQKARAYLKT